MALLFPAAQQFFDDSTPPQPVGAGKLHVYDNETTDDAEVWSNPELTLALSNPVVLDSSGRLITNVYVADGTSFTVALDDSADAEKWSRDDVWGVIKSVADAAYTASGTGAVERTIQSRLRDFVTVFDFGAVGDGSTDDYQAFQDAIDSNRVIYVPAIDPAGDRYRYFIGTDTIVYPIDGYYDPGPIGFVGLGGRPEIMLGHTSGAGFHLRYNRHMMKEMQINSDATRQAATTSPLTANDNVGVLIAGDDIASGAGDRVHQGHVENVFVYNSPSDGFRILGSVVSLYMLGCEVDEAGGHGFNIDNGEYTGRTNTGRPGQNVYILCRASDCGGHAVRMGGTISGQFTPYRQQWLNFECFRCATDPGIRDGLWNISMFAENSGFTHSAFGGEGVRQCVFMAGYSNKLDNCRYINTAATNAVRVGDLGSGGATSRNNQIIDGYISNSGISPTVNATNLVAIEGSAKGTKVRFPQANAHYDNLTSLSDVAGNESDIEGEAGVREMSGSLSVPRLTAEQFDSGEGAITINDEAAVKILMSENCRGMFTIGGNTAGAESALVSFRVGGGSAFIHAIDLSGSGDVVTSNSVLTGLTGAAGDLTLSVTVNASPLDNHIYIENQTGANAGYAITFLSLVGSVVTDAVAST